MAHFVSGWTRGVQVKPLRTRAIPERLRGVFTTRRYTNSPSPLPLPTCKCPSNMTLQKQQSVGSAVFSKTGSSCLAVTRDNQWWRAQRRDINRNNPHIHYSSMLEMCEIQRNKPHIVCTISLRCYEILLQLFMLLYRERNAVVHPCKTFSMFPLWSVGEGTNFENVFFLKNLIFFWSVFAPQGRPM